MSIYFIRHGQSEFNAAYKQEPVDPMIFDAPLTALGIQQACIAREQVKQLKIQHVITSPFTRAIQTARTIFPGNSDIEVRSGHHELLLHSCDIGRQPSELKASFPELDFSTLDPDWWYQSPRGGGEIVHEPDDHFRNRIRKFVHSLDDLTSVPVAIVGHGNAFKEVIGTILENCEIHKYR